MEESDNMLLAGLRDYIPLSQDISTLRDIRTDQIYHLSCQIFDAIKIDYSELKAISKAQRFRSMTKLTQTLNKELDAEFELNDIMNPTLPFIRKLLLAFIGRFGAVEGDKGKKNSQGAEEKKSIREQREALKKWVQTEFICPELQLNKKKHIYQPYRVKLELKKDIFKRDISSQLLNVGGNAGSILSCAIMRDHIEIKKREAEEGINRRKQEQFDRNAMQIIRNNQKDWVGAQKQIVKMKKNMIQQKIDEEEQLLHTNDQHQPMSVFQQEVETLAEENKNLKQGQERGDTKVSEVSTHEELPEDPIERIKRECQNKRIQLQIQLQEILNMLAQKKQGIEEKERLKKQLEDQMQQYEERSNTEKQERQSLKKKAEKLKIMLDSVEGETDLSAEVRQLSKEVEYLESEANKQIGNMEAEIQNIRKEGDRKLQILSDLKIKLNKIENGYQNICEEIEEKNQIKGKVKINKSGLSRLYYSKKITEMEVRWRETQKETKKITQTVGNIREQIRRTAWQAERVQTQIDNLTNSGKFRTQNENSAFKDVFKRCQKTFNHTMASIQKINETKNEIQEYEMKVHTLAGKDYKQNIRRLQLALEELRREMRENSK